MGECAADYRREIGVLMGDVKLVGHSGCKLERRGNLVVKTSSSEDYNIRIANSYEKIIRQTKTLFRVPRSGLKMNDDGLMQLEMEYIGGELAIDRLISRPDAALNFARNLVQFIEGNKSSKNTIVTNEVLAMKLFAIGDMDGVEKLKRLGKFSIRLPSGYCHGDLTFSNMIFADGGGVYLIDHLDSYIESPVMDYIKLFQDVDYFWSTRYSNLSTYSIEFYRAMGVMRNVILSAIDKEEWFAYSRLLQYINLARIIPYAKDPKVVDDLRYFMRGLL